MKKLTANQIKTLNKQKSITKLLYIIKILRDPINGCPWDIKQNYTSLSQYPIEEAYELQEAVEKNDIINIKEELGDLLLQVVLFSEIGSEKKHFNFDKVAEEISNKLIRRHPQIFDRNYKKNDTPKETWEKIKLEEKKNKKNSDFYSILDDIPNNMPALIKSFKIQKKASLINFDWDDYKGVLKKLDEEMCELKLALKAHNNKKHIEEELGDLMFTIVSLSRHLKLNPEKVLNNSIKKFKNRFLYVEKKIYDKKINVNNNKNILNKYWKEAKKI